MMASRSAVAYIDGGARGNPGPAGYGVRIESPDGALVKELHTAIGVATNNVAEYRSLLAALSFLVEHGYSDVTVRSDSQLLTKQMVGDYRVRSPGLKPLFREARVLVSRFDRVRFEHVPRTENTHADRLANTAMDDLERRSVPKNVSEPTIAPPETDHAALPSGAVLAVGVDFESISRVDDLLQRYGERFLHRVFTDGEVTYSQCRKFPAQHLTGRFCAKEATMKALGTGRSLGVLWKNVEVVRETTGPPKLVLHGGAADRCSQLGADRTLVTITHSGDFAFAQVLLLKA